MPHFYPDPPRILNDNFGERTVLAALRTLPPDAHVFVNPVFLDPSKNRERELDFVVLHPHLGIVIIEAKGKGVLSKGDHWVRCDRDGREERLDEDPVAQLQGQQWFLLHWLQERVSGFIPQVTRVLALPFYKGEPRDLGPGLPACRVLTEETLKSPFVALKAAVSGGDWEAFQKSKSAASHHASPEQLNAFLAVLKPAVLLPPSLAEILAEEDACLEHEGKRFLDHLASNFSRGRYRVQGAPGSGKSWLGRKVARLWAAEGRRVLVVAFNRALTYATQCALDDVIREGAVVVSTFHDLASVLLEGISDHPACSDDPEGREVFFNQTLPKAFSEALPRISARWDALVIDEAQDLAPEWIASLQRLLVRPDEDPVLLLEDPAQSLYRTARHAFGTPWRLDLSLRQGARLRNAAIKAFPECGWALVSEGDPAPSNVFQAQTTTPKRWREDLQRILDHLLKEGVDPGRILVLSPHRPRRLGLADGERLGPWPLNLEADWWEGEKAGHLRVGTIHAFKGLEADIVIYLAPSYEHPEEARLRYTAISRARHRVFVLESAIPQPPKAKPVHEAPVVSEPVHPVHPPRANVHHVHELGEESRLALMEALKVTRCGARPKKNATEFNRISVEM